MQLNFLVIMVGIICVTLLIQLFSERNYIKRVRLRLCEEYGSKPDDTVTSHDKEGISNFYNLVKKTIPKEELVDDITWNDLDMDKIFSRLNCTTSFIGEQYLYSELHKLPKNKDDFMTLYSFIGETDLSIVVGSFRQSLKDFCIPSFCKKELAMTGIYHPLIDDAVPNDFQLNQNIIITGSNASGKSTFMKAVAVNLILGQNIHTCSAKNMVIPDVSVLTSMAVRDDILSGESYYIKEIKYLKRMIESSQEDRMVFCGIDEILRGTNTMERVAASIAILNYLNKKNCMLMVASHDLALAKTLENSYENYYFCEQIDAGNVVFDYKLRSGISNANNAIRLLESMGFPDEIVMDSRGSLLGGLQ